MAALVAGVAIGCSGPTVRERTETPLRVESASHVDPQHAKEPASDPRRAPTEYPWNVAGEASLAELLWIALERSAWLESGRAAAEAASAASSIDGSWPDPRVTFGWYAREVETRTGTQEWSLAVQQRVPLPSKLARLQDRAGIRARIARLRYEARARDLLADIVAAAYEIAYLEEAIALTDEILETFDELRVVASTDDDRGVLALERLRAEAQFVTIENDRIALGEQRAVERERLRALLQWPRESPLPAAIRIPSPPALEASLANLVDRAERVNQDLRIADLEYRARRIGAKIAREDAVPDMTVGATYIGTSRRPDDVDPDGNGEDPVILQFGIDVPLGIGRRRAESSRAARQAESAAADSLVVLDDVRVRVTRAYWRVVDAARLHSLHDSMLLPQAAAAVEASRARFEERAEGFASVIETLSAWHGFRIARARAMADHGIAVAGLERAIGEPLERKTTTTSGPSSQSESDADEEAPR